MTRTSKDVTVLQRLLYVGLKVSSVVTNISKVEDLLEPKMLPVKTGTSSVPFALKDFRQNEGCKQFPNNDGMFALELLLSKTSTPCINCSNLLPRGDPRDRQQHRQRNETKVRMLYESQKFLASAFAQNISESW